MSYISIAARELGACLHTECWSGRGVVRNYGDKNRTSAEPMPAFYPRALATDPASKWDFAQYQSNVVLVNLGSKYCTKHKSEVLLTQPLFCFLLLLTK